MKRIIYQQLLDWKEKRNGEVALLIEGARCIDLSSALHDAFIVNKRSVNNIMSTENIQFFSVLIVI